MKTLSILALCTAFSCSVAHAATATSKPAAPAATAAATKPAANNPALHGFWKSVNAEGIVLPGTMEFKADGSAVLAPKGEEKLEGTWVTKGKELHLTMPPYGTAQMQYAINPKGLTLTYENGFKQKFVKEVPKK